MNEKDFWLSVRAALIMFVRAIEKRYELKTYIFEMEVTKEPKTVI